MYTFIKKHPIKWHRKIRNEKLWNTTGQVYITHEIVIWKLSGHGLGTSQGYIVEYHSTGTAVGTTERRRQRKRLRK